MSADRADEPFTDTSKAAHLLSRSVFDLAYEVLEQSAISHDLVRWTTSPRGRTPRGLTVVDVLAAIIVLALQGKCPHFREIARLLHDEMPEHERRARGITRPWPTTETGPRRRQMVRAAEEAVRRRFMALVRVVDPTALSGNRSRDLGDLVADVQEQHANDPDGQIRAIARDVMLDVMNQIVQGSLDMVPPEVLTQMGTAFAIDGTFTPTWARGTKGHRPVKAIQRAAADLGVGSSTAEILAAAKGKGSGVASADPQAGYYIRDYGSGEVNKGFGYEANLAVATDTRSETNSVRMPSLVLGVTIDTPSFDPGNNAIELVTRVQDWAGRQNRPMKTGVFDALYPSLGLEFKRALRQNGVMPIHRLPRQLLGKSGASFEGNTLIEGVWYCSAMPKKLVDASKDREADLIDSKEYKKRIEARRTWESYRVTGTDVLDANGDIKSHRFECPSSRRGGEHSCARDTATPKKPGDLPLPVKPLPLDVPAPRACTQKTFTIPSSVGLEHEQALPYMTPEWNELNSRFRSTNEGKNGTAKDPSKEGIGTKGVRRVNGIAANGLMLACQLAANNLRSTRNFLHHAEPDEQGIATRRYSAYRAGRPYRKKVPGLTSPAPTGRAPSARAAAVIV